MVTSDAFTPGCVAVRIVMELADCSLEQLLKWAQMSSSSDNSSGGGGWSGGGASPFSSTTGTPSLLGSSDKIILNMSNRLRIAESVAAGLSHLHSGRHPVVHRDLKPANILIRRQGGGEVSACIADFGLSLLDKPDMTLVSPEAYCPEGTPRYMAPEIIDPSVRGRNAVDAPLDLKAADVYSMGCLLRALMARLGAADEPRQSWFESMSTEEVTPSVASMLEAMAEGTPRRCAEVIRACLLPAAERPSPEFVAVAFRDELLSCTNTSASASDQEDALLLETHTGDRGWSRRS
jgi:serine/threonine protein kinase